MVAPEETRSSRRPEADGADDRALLKPNDTEETPLEGGFPDAAARPSGYRRITTLALCVAVTVSVVGLRRISTRPASAVASLSKLSGSASLEARQGAASRSKLSGAALLEAQSGAMTPKKLSELSGVATLSKKEKKSVREDDDDFLLNESIFDVPQMFLAKSEPSSRQTAPGERTSHVVAGEEVGG